MDSNPLHRASIKHVSAEELQICWGDNPSYWEMVCDKNSIMFPKKIARLKEVCWFDVKGEIMCSLPPGAYTFSWRAHLSPGSCGWVSERVHFTFSKNETEVVSECKCCIDRTSFGVLSSQTQMEHYSSPTMRAVENGWTEYDVGEFVVEEGEKNCALKFSMVATGGRWKSGLSLDGIFIRPKGLMDVVPAQLLSNRADCDAGPSHSTIAADTIKEDVEVSRVELEGTLAMNEGDCEEDEDKYEEDENEEEQDQDDEDSHQDVSLYMEPAHGTYMRFREFYHIPSTVMDFPKNVLSCADHGNHLALWNHLARTIFPNALAILSFSKCNCSRYSTGFKVMSKSISFSDMAMSSRATTTLRAFLYRRSIAPIVSSFSSSDSTDCYMDMYSEIFSLGAFKMSDMISILLNVMKSGLYYKAPEKLTKEDCLRLATVLALASGDPTALTTDGGSIHSLDKKPETQWLRFPVVIDSSLPRSKSGCLPKSAGDLAVTELGLQLDMQLICTSADVACAEPRCLSIARFLIDHRAMCKSLSSDQGCALWLDDYDDNKSVRLYHIQALACALQLGPTWMHRVNLLFDVCGRIPRVHSGRKPWRANLDFQDAVYWAQTLKFDEALGPDMGETWKEYEQVNIGNHEEPSLQVGEHPMSSSTFSPGTLSSEAHNCYWILLQFTDQLVFTSLAVTNHKGAGAAAYADTDFAVQILHLSSTKVPPFLVFAPICNNSGADSSLMFCMPKILANDVYRTLSRLWILKECGEDSTGRRFELISKTRLVGIANAPEGEKMGKVVVVG